MDMHVFQIESNKILPVKGSILISSPFLQDQHFTRSVILLIEHGEEGTMGITVNKDFNHHLVLNDLVPTLEFVPQIPIYNGGPMSRDTIFFLHTLKGLKGALPLGNGLYLNGDFEDVQKYILEGNPVEGKFRFFLGYAGWENGQLLKEIEENSWMVSSSKKDLLLNCQFNDLWHDSLTNLGGKYAIWARYPQYPYLN